MVSDPQSSTVRLNTQGPSGNFRQAGLSRPLGLDPGRCGARGVRRTLLTAHTARVLFLRCGAYPLDRGNHGRNVSSHKRGCLKPAGKTDMHGSPGRPHFCLSRAPGAARPLSPPALFLTQGIHSHEALAPRNSKKVRWPARGEDNAHLRSYHPLKGPDSGRRESDASTRTGSDTWPTPSPHRDVPHVILCLAAGRTACRNRLGLDGGIRGWAA